MDWKVNFELLDVQFRKPKFKRSSLVSDWQLLFSSANQIDLSVVIG